MKFLFITHNTSMSGAPKTMLFFLNELKNVGHEFDVIALDGGALESQFSSVASEFYSVNSFSKSINYDLKSRIYKKLFNKKFESEYTNFVNKISSTQYDFIYVNTIVSLNIGIELKKRMDVKLLLHLHELSTVIDEYVPDLKEKDLYVDQYIVPSVLNKKCLIDDFLIDETKIDIIESVSEIDFSKSNSKNQKNEFRVLMTGGAYWRKGDDLFIQIAKKVNSMNSTIKFYWVGYSSEERKRVNQYDIRKTNLTNTVFFKPEQSDLSYWYQNSDVFLLPSREDPFPLSAIEAGMAGLPILCFKDATGISTFLDNSCVFNYLDTDSVAFKILQFFDDSSLANELGEKNKLVFQKFTAKNQISKICNVISSLN